jgi:hypothetical protein
MNPTRVDADAAVFKLGDIGLDIRSQFVRVHGPGSNIAGRAAILLQVLTVRCSSHGSIVPFTAAAGGDSNCFPQLVPELLEGLDGRDIY